MLEALRGRSFAAYPDNYPPTGECVTKWEWLSRTSAGGKLYLRATDGRVVCMTNDTAKQEDNK